MDDILQEFLTECTENVTQLDSDLVALEREPANPDLLNAIFRTIHTVKGTCGFLGLVRLEAVAHSAESVLALLRGGTLQATPEVISDILRAVDVVKLILAALAHNGKEPPGDDALVIGMLDSWLQTRDGGAPLPSHVDDTLLPDGGVPDGGVPNGGVPNGGLPDGAMPGGKVPPVLAAPVVPAVPEPTTHGFGNTSLRVNVTLLDRLMNMVGELVLSRNQLIQLAGHDDASRYYAPIQQLNRITTDLQEVVMQTRMQPVGAVWSKLPRVIRDIAQSSGKQIAVEMTGAQTELDRQLMQAIQDPLTHIVRNSADHGIELPNIRRACGKPETGTIYLNAYHESGHVIIEITDDGAGFDPDAIRRKAVARGLLHRDAVETLTDPEVLRFVFEPGFSTADQVTHVSGRGVGMDVVRSNIEKIGGTVELESARGQGCTVCIRIPLTLAIVPALLVEAGGETFAVPQGTVVELIRVSDASSPSIERIHNVSFYRLRDMLLPLVDLDTLLRLPSHRIGDEYNIVVCQLGEARFGLVVDEVFDTQEIVVKPVGRRVKTLACYAGCTILGDGRVIMILDPTGIAGMSGVKGGTVQDRPVQETTVVAHTQALERLLLFDNGSSTPHAVPLSRVARLEEIPVSKIEQADGRELVQYRGTLLPLLSVGAAERPLTKETRSVIVFNDGVTSLGLAVQDIQDIVEDAVTIEVHSNRPGILGTAVVAGRATEIVDMEYFLAQLRAPSATAGGSVDRTDTATHLSGERRVA